MALLSGEEDSPHGGGTPSLVQMEGNVDALLLMLFALCTTPLVLVSNDMRLSEHEGLSPVVWPGVEMVEVVVSPGRSGLGSDDMPIAG